MKLSKIEYYDIKYAAERTIREEIDIPTRYGRSLKFRENCLCEKRTEVITAEEDLLRF